MHSKKSREKINHFRNFSRVKGRRSASYDLKVLQSADWTSSKVATKLEEISKVKFRQKTLNLGKILKNHKMNFNRTVKFNWKIFHYEW